MQSFSRELARQQGGHREGVLPGQEAVSRQDARLRDGRPREQGQDVRGRIQRKGADRDSAGGLRPLFVGLYQMHEGLILD